MITIQSALFLALGFLVASLLWLLAAPSFWARAVRLTTRRLRETMPLTDVEIRADKDRLRAEYALKIHQQQVSLEETKLASARQVIELNRRDAHINGLEADVEALTSSLEGAANARAVLEQTVAARLPRIEERLIDAKRNLSERDTEITNLTRTAERQARALKEAQAINDQLKREAQTLTTALEAAGAKAPGRAAEDRTDGFVAMRAELNALRARTREQSALIDRLQKAYAETIGPSGQPAAKANGSGKAGPALADAKAANGKAANGASDKKLRETATEHEQEIARLKAAVAVYEKASRTEGGGVIPESRIALKASLGALEEKSSQQDATIKALRAEVAGLQEQLTLQTAGHVAEVGRLGAGTLPVSGAKSGGQPVTASTSAEPPESPAPRERRAIPRLTLAERVAQSRLDTPEDEAGATPPDPLGPIAITAGADAPDAGDRDTPPSESAAETSTSSDEQATRRPARIKSRLLDRLSDLSKAKA
ncbi:MAG: hypothetical protein ABI391_01640 [Hyphomicrobiaceae bacterium]